MEKDRRLHRFIELCLTPKRNRIRLSWSSVSSTRCLGHNRMSECQQNVRIAWSFCTATVFLHRSRTSKLHHIAGISSECHRFIKWVAVHIFSDCLLPSQCNAIGSRSHYSSIASDVHSPQGSRNIPSLNCLLPSCNAMASPFSAASQHSVFRCPGEPVARIAHPALLAAVMHCDRLSSADFVASDLHPQFSRTESLASLSSAYCRLAMQ
jgi:hypothetical protein